MTFREALKKKYGRGLLGSLLFYPRIWHLFSMFAREYEKKASLSAEQQMAFRRVFGD